jgi:periplasmic protein TonB
MIDRGRKNSAEVGMTPIGTAIVWVGCLVVGLTGLVIPAVHQPAPHKQLSPVQAMLIHVELSRDNSRASPTVPPVEPEPAPLPANLSPPAAPPMTAVAAPSASIAFALPTSGPARNVSAAQAAPSQAQADVMPTRIVYGQGEGQQPKPDYPLEAQIARQYGKVLVRFTIGEDGSVTSAKAIGPCPYPLLNQSAVRTIHEEWRFEPGPGRVREIIIEFDPKHP